MVSLCAQAQVYLGGTVGLATVSSNGGDSKTSFKLMPEIGYNLNRRWALGVAVGYQKGTYSMLDGDFGNDEHAYTLAFSPYARYKFVRTNVVDVFVDMGFAVAGGERGDRDFNAYTVGVQPGVAVTLTPHLSFVGKFGFLGYQQFDPEGDFNGSTSFGFDVNGNNIQFGLYYNF